MSRLYSLDFDGGRIGLAATGGSPSVGRVYLGSQDALRVIADENTAIPGGTGKFEDFPDLQAVAFDAAHDRVAFLGGADVGGGAIQQLGVYEAAAGALRLIVNQETVVPGKAQKFGSGLCGVAYDDGVLGFSSGLHGVYRVAGNELVAVVKRSTPIPGGTGTFGHFGCRLAMDDGAIAFEGDNNAAPRQAGIFFAQGGTTTKIIAKGDTLDGKTVVDAFLDDDESLEGKQVVFRVNFVDSTRGLYRAFVE